MRWVIVRVLPVPAPASTHTGPRGAMTACRCSGSKPSRSRGSSVMPGILADPLPRSRPHPGTQNHVSNPGMLLLISTSHRRRSAVTFRPWEEIEAELNAKLGLTPEELERDVRELEAYYNGYRLAE